MCYIFWVCVCSLSIQNTMSMRHIFFCSLPRSTIFWFSLQLCLIHFSFSDKILPNHIFVFTYSTGYSCQIFKEICILATYFGNNNQILNSMKTRSVPAELFCEKRRTDGRSDGRTDGQTWQSELSLFTIFRTRLKLRYWHKLFKFTFYCVSKCLFFTISVCHMEWHHLISL